MQDEQGGQWPGEDPSFTSSLGEEGAPSPTQGELCLQTARGPSSSQFLGDALRLSTCLGRAGNLASLLDSGFLGAPMKTPV